MHLTPVDGRASRGRLQAGHQDPDHLAAFLVEEAQQLCGEIIAVMGDRVWMNQIEHPQIVIPAQIRNKLHQRDRDQVMDPRQHHHLVLQGVRTGQRQGPEGEVDPVAPAQGGHADPVAEPGVGLIPFQGTSEGRVAAAPTHLRQEAAEGIGPGAIRLEILQSRQCLRQPQGISGHVGLQPKLQQLS